MFSLENSVGDSTTKFEASNIFFGDLFLSTDPMPFHYEAARRIIEDEIDIRCFSSNEIDQGVDLLARELLNSCRALGNEVHKFVNVNLDINLFCHELAGMLWIDYLMLSNFSKKGPVSEKIAEEQSDKSKKIWGNRANLESSQIWSLWTLSDDCDLTLTAPLFFYILAYGLWYDLVKVNWERGIKNVPALTIMVLDKTIKPVLQGVPLVELYGDSIIYSNCDGKIIETIPCVDNNNFQMIYKGMHEFSTLTGHKLIRWQVRTGFDQWASGCKDYRKIITTGGYEGIAKLIGCKNDHKAIPRVRALLHAQAHGYFELPTGNKGNMIILEEAEKHQNGENSKIIIILGDCLLPNYTHRLPKGDHRRLIPIIDLPPLVGANNLHSFQAMLQLLILEEFSDQSPRLVNYGSILITEEKLKDLCKEAKLPFKQRNRVIQAWIEGNEDSPPFIIKDGEEYCLSNHYDPVTRFLKQQGIQRINGAIGGKRSAAARKKIKDSQLNKYDY